jgi:hypothetical protein
LVGTAKVLIDTMFTNPAWTLLMLHNVDSLKQPGALLDARRTVQVTLRCSQ